MCNCYQKTPSINLLFFKWPVYMFINMCISCTAVVIIRPHSYTYLLKGWMAMAIFRLYVPPCKKSSIKNIAKCSNFKGKPFGFYLYWMLFYGHKYHMPTLQADLMINLLTTLPPQNMNISLINWEQVYISIYLLTNAVILRLKRKTH